MKTGKEIILDYCDNIKTGDIDHLQSCIDIRESLRRDKNDRNYLISHCPGAFGLDDFIGDCKIKNVGIDSKEQLKQCEECWDKALSIKIQNNIKVYCCDQDCIYYGKSKILCSNKEIIVDKAYKRVNIVFDNKYPICPYYIEENK